MSWKRKDDFIAALAHDGHSRQGREMDALFATLNQRKRPEDVAQMVLERLQKELLPWQKRILERAARGSLKKQLWGYTSMLQEFARPVGLRRQVSTAND